MFFAFLIFGRPCETKIYDYAGIEINESMYETNTIGFRISSNCKNVKVDGENYVNGTTIYKIHDNYEISDDERAFNVSIKAVPEEKRNYYYIYMHGGTMPVVLSMLDFIHVQPKPKEMRLTIGRGDTLNETFLKQKYPFITSYKSQDSLLDEYIYMQKVIHDDPYAYIKIFVDDIRVKEYYFFGYCLGLDKSRFDATLTSDGGNTYIFFREKYDNNIDDAHNSLNKIIDDAVKGVLPIDHSLGSLTYSNTIFTAIQISNCRLWLNNPSLLIPSNNRSKEELTQMNMRGMNINEIVNNFNETEKELYQQIFKFDIAEFKNKYFPGEKPPLFVTGTNDFGWYKSEDRFILNFEKVIEIFGENYTIIYKPHPHGMPSKHEKFNNFLIKNNISVITDMLPFELVVSAYDDVYYGGFDSTIYLNVQPNHTLFFFAENSSSLSFVTEVLEKQGYFANALYFAYQLSEYQPKTSHSLLWLWISLGLLIVAAVIAFVVYKYKCKKTQINDELLTNINITSSL